MKCNFSVDDGRGPDATCYTHNGLRFRYFGSPECVMHHRCPLGLHEDGFLPAEESPPLPKGDMYVLDNQVVWRQPDGSYLDRNGKRIPTQLRLIQPRTRDEK